MTGWCASRVADSFKATISNLPTQPQKILIVTDGSRGDIQPYIALGSGLKSKSYTVGIVVPENFKVFAEDAGMKCYPVLPDLEYLQKTDKILYEAGAKGDFLAFIKRLAECKDEFKERIPRDCIAAFEDFKPDLVVEGTLMYYWKLLAMYRWKVPTITIQSQAAIYDPKRMCLGFPTLPFGLHRYILWNLLAGGVYDAAKGYENETKKLLGYGVCDIVSRSKSIADYKAPPLPIYITQSPLFKEVLYPCAHPNFELIGACIIPSQAQQQFPANFGDTCRIEKFLAAGKIVGIDTIYCGFGSMICKSPEYMTELVVSALMHCGKRAIVLSGWANLSMESLKRATQDDLLMTYAEKNILFVEKAPHEWLFPQLACIVHHGGAGTTTAAMRAGVPTVITPFCIDQYDHAYLVNELGVGFGFNKSIHKTAARELGDAIASVASNPSVVAKAKDIGTKLRAENGVQAAVRAIEKYWVDTVLSGQFHSYVASVNAIKDMPSQATCFSFLQATLECLHQKSLGGKNTEGPHQDLTDDRADANSSLVQQYNF